MKLHWIILLAVLALIIGASIWGSIAKKNAPIPVTTAKVERKDFIHEVTGTGNVEAKVYSLSFTTPGRVARVLVKEQDTVKAGALLAELDIDKDRQSLAASRERLSSLYESLRSTELKMRNDQQKLQEQQAQLRRQYDLARRLLAVGAESQETVRDQQRQLDGLRGDLDSLHDTYTSTRSDLQAQISQAKADIQRTTQTIADAQLTAPVNGAIAQVDFRSGEAAQGVIKLVESGSLRVKAQIQEADAGQLTVGMPARIELDADRDHPLTAVISELGVMATVKSEGSSATLPVKFRLTDPGAESHARDGYVASVTITTQRFPKVLQIPLEAVIEEKKDGVRAYSVWVMTPKITKPGAKIIPGTVRKQAITVTARNLTAAVATELPDGTQVVTLPPDTLAEGKLVVVNTGKEEKKTP